MINPYFVSLVKGERYEKEFTHLKNSLQNFELSKYTPEVFNFNEKANAYKSVCNISTPTVILDTDHLCLSPDIDRSWFKLSEGIHVRSFRLIKDKSKLEQDININGYFDILKQFSGREDIYFLDESLIIINLPNKFERNTFLKNWQTLIDLTKNNTPVRKSDNHPGALEGCLIALAAKDSMIDIITNEATKIFSSFYHYGPQHGHLGKLNLSVI